LVEKLRQAQTFLELNRIARHVVTSCICEASKARTALYQ
jgi:hypothetical protein